MIGLTGENFFRANKLSRVSARAITPKHPARCPVKAGLFLREIGRENPSDDPGLPCKSAPPSRPASVRKLTESFPEASESFALSISPDQNGLTSPHVTYVCNVAIPMLAWERCETPTRRISCPALSGLVLELLNDPLFPKLRGAQIKFMANSLAGLGSISPRRSRDICSEERTNTKRRRHTKKCSSGTGA